MIKGCIFDLSGTVVDRYSLTSFLSLKKIFYNKGIYLTNNIIFKNIELNKKDHIRNILYNINISQNLEKNYHKINEEDVISIVNDFNKLQTEYSEKMIDILPETKNCIHTLQSNEVQIGCTTSFNYENMDIIRTKLNRNNIYFNSYVSSSCLNKPTRPNPYMIYKNMELLNISNPKNIIKLDNTTTGIQEGINANCITIGVAKWSVYMKMLTLDDAYYFHHDLHKGEMDKKLIHCREILKKAGADFVIDSLNELAPIIEKINNK